jgi:CheY-like chemotaxis protein/two-component sensor histidine kinase
VSRITTGKVTLNREPLDVAALLAHAIESTRTLIDAKRHALEFEPLPERLRVYGDITRLSQVIWNLLNNAAKYTPEGGSIYVSAARDGEYVLIRVRDNGIGIPPYMLETVFDLFIQGDRGLDRAEGGLGIGLTLVRRIVTMHGGRVEAMSDGVGRGAEFRVWLPLASADAGDAAAPSSELQDRLSATRRRVLVVDDNKDSAESLAVLLRLAGHEVDTAHDGIAALSSATRSPPQVVLLDIGLPGMDGYEVAREIRSSPNLSHVRIVAMTGYGQEQDRRRTQEAGFDAHLVKPLSPDDIERALS